MECDGLISLTNHYELLGVSKSVDAKTLHKAFRTLSKALHPDTTSLPLEEAACKFRQICEAYELLSDPIRRLAYDNNLDEVNLDKTAHIHEPFIISLNSGTKLKIAEVRRTLSGSEMLSLLLLAVAFLMSLLLALGFALANGRELQVRPSWLMVQQHSYSIILHNNSNVSVASISNSAKSTFLGSIRNLAE